MRLISNLNRKLLTDQEFYDSQFENFGTEKNILFLSPQLSGKQIYKSFLPYFHLFNDTVKTAITYVGKYDPIEQLTDINAPLNTNQITWADFIVIPFTTQSLTDGETNLYEAIRQRNEQCQIVYSIDFNYYELSNLHPYKKIFTDDVIEKVEENIWYSDICMVSNMPFRDELLKKMKSLSSGRMANIPTKAEIACMPFYIDTKIMLANIDYDVQEPQRIGDNVSYKPSTKKRMDSVLSNNKKQIRILKEDGKWVLKKGNYKKPIESYATKSIAIKEADKWIEKKYDIIIYKVDGTVHNHITVEHQKNK